MAECQPTQKHEAGEEGREMAEAVLGLLALQQIVMRPVIQRAEMALQKRTEAGETEKAKP